MYHHKTIRKYVSALMNLLKNLEVEDEINNEVITKKIPIRYSVNEKSSILSQQDTEILISGNYNILPRSRLSLVALTKDDSRTTNKNLKITKTVKDNEMEFMWNSVPYDFVFEFSVMVRGMNQATQVIEQIAPIFNPIYNIDIWDADSLDEPSRIPVKLMDITMDPSDFDDYSFNLITVNFSLMIAGRIYPPVKTLPKINNFNYILLDNEEKSREQILGFDVISFKPTVLYEVYYNINQDLNIDDINNEEDFINLVKLELKYEDLLAKEFETNLLIVPKRILGELKYNKNIKHLKDIETTDKYNNKYVFSMILVNNGEFKKFRFK